MIYIFFGLILILIILIFILMVLSGLFYNIKIDINNPPFGYIFIAYKFHQNSYSECKSAFLELDSIECLKKYEKIGLYYDDPNIVEKGKQRYAIGVILGHGDNFKIGEDVQKKLDEKGFSYKSIHAADQAVLSKFPFITGLSIFLAVWRVYPKLQEFIKKNGLNAYPFVEYYPERRIEFVVPLSNQNDFCVKEYDELEKSDQYYINLKKDSTTDKKRI